VGPGLERARAPPVELAYGLMNALNIKACMVHTDRRADLGDERRPGAHDPSGGTTPSPMPTDAAAADAGAVAPVRRRDGTVRRHLAVLVLALALPVTLFVGVLLWRFADAERARLEAQALAVAHSAALSVDRELAGLISTVEVVSLFDSLRTGDLRVFHGQARAVQERTGIDVVLRDPSGQQVANTRRPWGEPLPKVNLDIDAEALRTGRPVVSNLNAGVVAQGEPLFAITRPVAQDGEAAYCSA
jgi:hypothetical protein